MPRRERWGAAAILLLVVAASHYDVIVQGRSLIASNFSNPMDFRAGPENYGPRFVPHDTWTARNLWPYANIRDPGATWWQWEPSTRFLEHAIAEREWPFWDPYIAAGTPAMANLVPAFFFPPYLIVVLLGAPVALLNAYFLVILWAAAFFTFLFIRRHDVTFVAAMGGALAMLFSGTVQQHAGTFIGQTAACLPLVLYTTRVFLDTPDRRRTVLLAATYAMAALASFPPLLVAIFGLAAVYALVAVWLEAGLRRRAAAVWWAAAVALALGLVAFYYAPALLARAASPQVSEFYKDAGLETMPVLHAYQLLSPTLMGGVQYYINPVTGPNQGPYLPYAGIVAIALALVARTCPKCKSRTLLIAGALSVALLLLKLVGMPGVQWIGGLPVLREIHIAHYFGVPVPFLVACLGALGLDALWKGTLRPGRAMLAAGILIGITESLWQIAEYRRFFRSPFVETWVRDWRVLGTVTIIAATAIAVAALARQSRPARGVCVAILVAAGLFEGVFNTWLPRPAAWSVFDNPPPYVRAMQQVGPSVRLFPAGALGANLNVPFGVPSIGSLMAFNPPRAFTLYRHYTAPQPTVFMREPTRLPPDPVLDRANIGLISTNRFAEGIVKEARARGYSSPFDDGLIMVFSRPTEPRYVFSSEYRIVPEAAALDAIASPNVREIVLERDPGFAPAPNRRGDPSVRVESFRLNSVVLAVDAPRPGLLYASDSYFDGWRATVNGAAAEILPANYAFRAVVVPEGHSRVEFRYWPPGLTAGIAITVMSGLAALAMLFARPTTRRVATASASAQRTMSVAP